MEHPNSVEFYRTAFSIMNAISWELHKQTLRWQLIDAAWDEFCTNRPGLVEYYADTAWWGSVSWNGGQFIVILYEED